MGFTVKRRVLVSRLLAVEKWKKLLTEVAFTPALFH